MAAAGTRQTGGLIKVKATGGGGAGETPATSELDGDLSEDPIAQSLQARIQSGGLGTNASEADAKKNNYPVFKAAKHPTLKDTKLVDIALPAAAGAAGASPNKKTKPPTGAASGLRTLKPPTKTGAAASKGVGAAKKGAAADNSGIDLGPDVPQDEDPIAASLKARIAAGGLGN